MEQHNKLYFEDYEASVLGEDQQQTSDRLGLGLWLSLIHRSGTLKLVVVSFVP